MRSERDKKKTVSAVQSRMKEIQREDVKNYKDLLYFIPDIVYKIDPDGRFVFVNEAVHNLGYEPEELIGKHFSVIVYPEDVENISSGVVLPKYVGKRTGGEEAPKLFDERRTGSRMTRGLVFRLLPKSTAQSALADSLKGMESKVVWGELFTTGYINLKAAVDKGVWVEGAARGHYEEDSRIPQGRFLGTIGIIRDITDRKRAEEILKQTLENLEKTLEGAVYALSMLSEKRDPYTGGHQQRVSYLASHIAEEMNLLPEQVKGIKVAGILHDIGKIYVPAEILSKPGKLTEGEFGVIKFHPQVGYDILKTIDFPWPVAQVALQHHERCNGSGYPAGLSDDQILLETKILSVADVVEAMTFQRPYRPALGIDEALKEVSNNKGTLYDPASVDACLTLFRKKNFTFE
ncbi:MAG: HD domain-containing phosphohydrolase [Candidatus Omnitrophota bacterium]